MPAAATRNDPRRVHQRHSTDTVTCPLGTVHDLSATGMRISVKGYKLIQPGQVIPIRLKAGNTCLAVKARVVWVDKSWHMGLLGREIGFAFDGLKPDQVKVLDAVARFGFLPRGKAARQAFDAASNPQQNEAPHSPFGGAKPDVTDESGSQKTQDGGSDWAWGEESSRVDVSVILSEYYQALGLATGASRSEIKAAYRKLAKDCHPDVAPGPENQKRFVEINQAYHMLLQNVD